MQRRCSPCSKLWHLDQLQVRVKEYGTELIEVADNGSGISPADYRALTLKYHTSKLQEFSDLQVRSFPLLFQLFRIRDLWPV